jgi:argininosuccinate synthase
MSNVLSRTVTGSARVKLYKGSAQVVSRQSPVSLYRHDLASFGAATSYDQADAAGFIRLFGLPIRAAVSVGEGEAAVSRLIQEVIEAGAL